MKRILLLMIFSVLMALSAFGQSFVYFQYVGRDSISPNNYEMKFDIECIGCGPGAEYYRLHNITSGDYDSLIVANFPIDDTLRINGPAGNNRIVLLRSILPEPFDTLYDQITYVYGPVVAVEDTTSTTIPTYKMSVYSSNGNVYIQPDDSSTDYYSKREYVVTTMNGHSIPVQYDPNIPSKGSFAIRINEFIVIKEMRSGQAMKISVSR